MNVVITGGNKGVGFATAKQIACDGIHRILILGRDENLLRRAVEEIISTEGNQSEIFYLQSNLTSEKDLNELKGRVESIMNSIEILINNAGKLVNKPLELLSVVDFRLVYDTNVIGLAVCTGKLLPLLERGALHPNQSICAHVINISSIGGIQGSMKFNGLSAYSSSKGAVLILTECMAEEFKEKHIHVNCLALGSVSTAMFKDAFPDFSAAVSPEEMGVFIADFALQRAPLFNGKIIPVASSTP